MIPLVDLQAQYKAIQPELDQALLEVVRSGQYILGKQLALLECELAFFAGCSYAVGVASGTDALFLSLVALGIGKGDKVVTTPFTFIATAEVIVRCGATPVFVDVDSNGNIDLNMVEHKMPCKAVIPVHLYGNPVNMTELMKMSSMRNFLVVEDACQALGATWDGKKIGSFGHTGCFSFFPSKNLGATGDAGMVVTNDEQVASLIKKLRNHGASTHYMYDSHGLNSRLDEIQAAILRVKLKHLDEWVKSRRELAYLYDSYLSGIVTLPPDIEGHAQNYYTIQVHDRDELRQYLAENEISTAIYYPLPLHLQKVYSYLGYKKGAFPMAESLSEKVLSLPMYPELPEEGIIVICDKIKEFYQR